jgi:hypothetical protein
VKPSKFSKKDFLLLFVVKSERLGLEGSRGLPPPMVHFLTSEAKDGVDGAVRGGETKDGIVRLNGVQKLGLGFRLRVRIGHWSSLGGDSLNLALSLL